VPQLKDKLGTLLALAAMRTNFESNSEDAGVAGPERFAELTDCVIIPNLMKNRRQARHVYEYFLFDKQAVRHFFNSHFFVMNFHTVC